MPKRERLDKKPPKKAAVIRTAAPSTENKRFDLVVSKTSAWEPPTAAELGARRAFNLPDGVQLYPTGLVVPHGMSEEEWEAVGAILSEGQSGVQWGVADWWAIGNHAYGERTALAAAKRLKYSIRSLMNMGTVARNVRPSFRNEDLFFTHHVAVASLEPEEQKKWLALAAEKKWSTRQLRKSIKALELNDTQSDDAETKDQSAEKWANDLIEMAKKARPPSKPLDFKHVELLDERLIERIRDQITMIADAWKELADQLPEYPAST